MLLDAEIATRHATRHAAARPPQTAVQRILAGDTDFHQRRPPEPGTFLRLPAVTVDGDLELVGDVA
ncbi:hypothetical protein [Streptomyces echinatus]|uniref:hypothetical protein n=1 Tax=Streptomyces echinatus TaxID=67293 RepID=UPI00382A56B7